MKIKNRRVECSTECRNVKTKATTAAGHEKDEESNGPIRQKKKAKVIHVTRWPV